VSAAGQAEWLRQVEHRFERQHRVRGRRCGICGEGPFKRMDLHNAKHRRTGELSRSGGPAEPATMATMPPTPGGLQEPGRAAWTRIWTAAPWLVPEADALLVGLVCSSLDQRAALQAMLDRDGPVIAGTRGTKVLHPAARQLRGIDGQLAGWLKALGLTPADRRRMPRARPAAAAPAKEAPSAPSRQRVKAIDPELVKLDTVIDANRAAGRPWWEGTRYGPDDDPLTAGREPQPGGGAYVHGGDGR
jgi:P27 family predicted phage terminase small subunit